MRVIPSNAFTLTACALACVAFAYASTEETTWTPSRALLERDAVARDARATPSHLARTGVGDDRERGKEKINENNNDSMARARSRASGKTSGEDGHEMSTRARGRALLGDGGWNIGTATWYGGPNGPGPDGMSIYTGSCGLGQNLPSHYVSAINTDGGYDYGLTDLCGKCFEVMCVSGRQRGLSNSLLGPWAGCMESGSKSITVMVTDSCPCKHPNPSNQRWCCGGENANRHFDLSYLSFDAIAIRHRGVVDIQYRPADCKDLGQEKYYS